MEASGQLLVPAALPPGNKPRYPLNRRLGGPDSRYGRFGEGNNLFPLPGFEPRTVQPIAYLLYSLSCRGCLLNIYITFQSPSLLGYANQQMTLSLRIPYCSYSRVPHQGNQLYKRQRESVQTRQKEKLSQNVTDDVRLTGACNGVY